MSRFSLREKMNNSQSGAVVALAATLLTACQSSPYVLETVVPHRIAVTNALDAHPVAAATAFLKPYVVGVDSLRKPYVGQSAMVMSAGRPESLLGNWAADALVAAAESLGHHPDLGVCNIGGLRASMPKDTVCIGDVMAIAPFNNYLALLQMRGSDVAELMNNIAAVHGEGVSSSARLVITRDGRLKSATIGGESIQADKLYTIATLDYLAEGNDKLYAFKKAEKKEVTPVLIRDAMTQRLRSLDAQGHKATAAIEGRIVEAPEGIAPPVVRQTEVGGPEQPFAISNEQGKGRTRELFIAHTNDTHSCIEPLSPLLADTAQADKGGFLRRAALLRDLRRQHPDLLLLDAGDFSQGTAYYNLYRGEVEVGLMNLMGYDAGTIGNHEFDYGLENMARLFRMAKFPIVCCNYDFTGTPVEGLVKPYVIIKRAGLKIGILGVSPELEGLVSNSNCPGVKYTDPIIAAQPVADYLRNEAKCDLVICIAHIGWDVPEVSDEDLIPATRNIDLVIGGHSHTFFASPQALRNLDGRAVPDNQMGKNARYLGTLQLYLRKGGSQ